MPGILTGILKKLGRRRQARGAGFLEILKARYHTFRIMLANHEYALELMKSADQSIKSGNPDLSEVIEELLSVAYEIVDGINRLSEGRHQKLFQAYYALAEAIRKELETVMAAQSLAPCIFLDDLSTVLRDDVGGKAATLGVLRQAGFPVPDGFAVTALSCEGILSANGLDSFIRQRAQKLEAGYSRGSDFEADAKEIRLQILDAHLPDNFEKQLEQAYQKLVGPEGAAISVRSSALVEDKLEHSFAGQFKSVLNVVSFDGLKDALREVIASNYSPESISYRLNAGLSIATHDMAVLCQRMVPAESAGVVFTVDPAAPESGRMLISAVPGLGVTAVSGSAPADVYRPSREPTDANSTADWAQIAEKTHRSVARDGGGIEDRVLSEDESNLPVLSEDTVRSLVRLSRRVESLIGKPQDIEWAVIKGGEIMVLQSRDIRLPLKSRQAVEAARGDVLLKGGVCASPGRGVGRVKLVHSTHDLDAWRKDSAGDPGILVLAQAMPDAAGYIPDFEGVVVDLGNPEDQLAVLAREYSRPMLTGAGKATQTLRDGQWVILDADMVMVFRAPEEVWSAVKRLGDSASESRRAKRNAAPRNETDRLRLLIDPLSPTRAHGLTFSIDECRSLHDLIQYSNQMAASEVFQTGDDMLKSVEALGRRLDDSVPLHFLIIDLGGGITPGCKSFIIRMEDVLSVPMQALLKGVLTPGLPCNQPPVGAMVSGLVSRPLNSSGRASPPEKQNYALITRDYLNLSVPVGRHLAMVDTVCGMNPRENYIHFRFKGGGTNDVQREQCVLFITEVLEASNFFVDQLGDLITASISETQQSETEDRLVMLGRLLGFSSLFDARIGDDTFHRRAARTFMDGDFALHSPEQ